MKDNAKKIILENKKTIIKLAISTVVTILLVIISNLFIQPQIFYMELANISKKHFVIECIFAISMFLFLNFVINFIDKLLHKDKNYKIWLINFGIYLIIMVAFLLIMWPGHWVWDEMNIFESVVKSEMNIWQSYITVIYMTLCLMLIPLPVGILIIQIILISAIVSYISTKIYIRYNKKIVNVILYILMLTPAIIINNLYPLRLTMYSYIMILFFSILIFDKMEKNKLTPNRLLKLYILISLLILWRSEGIIFAIFAPLLMFLVYNQKGINILKTLLLIVINGIIIVSYNNAINGLDGWIEESNNRYGLTIYINPLSEMLQYDLKGKNIEKNLQDIDKVLNLDILKKYPSYIEIQSYWSEPENLIREDYKEHMSAFKKSYIEIVINNMDIFLSARMKTFLATSCMYEGHSGNMDSRFLAFYMKNGYKEQVVEKFVNNYKLTKPINSSLKVNVENALLGRNVNDKSYNTAFGLIFWNVIPSILVIVVCGIISLIKKNWEYLLICISLISCVGIIFLTAPANYFMYYLPVYISAIIIGVLFITEYCNKINIERTTLNSDIKQN